MDSVFIPVLVFLCMVNLIVAVACAGMLDRLTRRLNEDEETSFTPLVKKTKRSARRKKYDSAIEPFMTAE